MSALEQTGTFRCQDRELAYRVYGEGARVTVLLHGLLLSQRMHEPLARALAERGNRVVTLDLLGHGSPSGRPTCGATRWASSPTRSSRCSTTWRSTRRSSAARRWAPT